MWKPVNIFVGDKSLDFMQSVIDPICEIMCDESARSIFEIHVVPEGEDITEYAAKCFNRELPILIKNHRESLVKIAAANKGISAKEYTDKFNAIEFANDVTGMIFDPAMRAFVNFVQPSTKSISFCNRPTSESLTEVKKSAWRRLCNRLHSGK